MTLHSDLPGYQAPHGGTNPPHILVTALKRDLFVFSRESQEVVVLELTCPWDGNIARNQLLLVTHTRWKSTRLSLLISLRVTLSPQTRLASARPGAPGYCEAPLP